jgi:tagaturonate reductase
MTLPKLNASLLPGLSSKATANQHIPTAGMLQLPEKVLQFGTGVLLRGLPDFFIDQANRQGVFNGRIVVVKSTDSGSADVFGEQDGLYTLSISGIEKGKAVEEYIVNASISRTLSAKANWSEILACATEAEMQVVISNTTEVGIQLMDDNIFGQPPTSFPGKLTAFLYERFKAFNGAAASGMVIVPCELIVDNGRKLKEIVLELAKQNQLSADFTHWLTQHNTFCNSLVDRIVPGKPDEGTAQKVFQKLGYTDELLTTSEVYHLWAIEGDAKVKEVLSFEKADSGVVIATDITPYRERKLRLLNGTHTISVALGYLYGLETVGECMNNAHLSKFITNVAHTEIAPAVPVDEASCLTFADEVLDRFRNPSIVHLLINITLQYTSKMKMRNIQTLLNYYQKFGSAPAHLSLGFAAYLLFMKGVKEEGGKFFGERNGENYPINDDFAGHFYQKWQGTDLNNIPGFVKVVLADQQVWGTNLSALPGFAETVAGYLADLMQKGVKPTVEKFLAEKVPA